MTHSLKAWLWDGRKWNLVSPTGYGGGRPSWTSALPLTFTDTGRPPEGTPEYLAEQNRVDE